MADVGATLPDGGVLVGPGEPAVSGADHDLPTGLERLRAIWGWGLTGLIGSVLVTLAGPRLVDDPTIKWWFHPSIPSGHDGASVAFYLGMVLLSVAWLGLGTRLAPCRGVRPFELWAVGALWCLPLVLGPALFSRDVYSYLAQGEIVHLGLSPYRDAPIVLSHLGHAHLLDAVSPFWRRTTAPYGPLFLALVSLVVTVSGSNLILGVLLLRVVELAGIVLLAVFVPRLAGPLGADPSRATWLAVLSPLVLLELVAPGHNDLLMIGLLVAAVTLAVEGHPLLGIVLCALAATIKLPAAAGVVFILVAWARTAPTRSGKLRLMAEGGLLAVGVGVVVSAALGLGFGWISTGLVSTPAKVRLAITPATGLGWTVAKLLQDIGITANSRGIESALGVLALAITAVLGVTLLVRVRPGNMVFYLAVLLLVSAAGGPAAWPWYFSWGLVLLAACPGPQRSIAIALAAAVAVFLVKPNGILALPLDSAPAVLGVYILIAAAAWHRWRRRRGQVARW